MSLRTLQSEFLVNAAKLILWAHENGFELTGGDLWRSPEECQRRGFINSQHGRRLAIDLNLFIEGTYMRSSAAHRPLGEYWTGLHELARWGGDWDDGNHYSFQYQEFK